MGITKRLLNAFEGCWCDLFHAKYTMNPIGGIIRCSLCQYSRPIRGATVDASRPITRNNYPYLFAAFLSIDICNGAVNRYEAAKVSYNVPAKHVLFLGVCESELAKLTNEEFESFCGEGDYDENMELLTRKPDLRPAHILLNAYFNGWIEE